MGLLLLGHMIGIEGVAHFLACLENGILEVQLSGFVVHLRYAEVRFKFTLRKEGLRERSSCLCEELGRIDDHHTCTIGPACRTRNIERGIEL